MMSKVQQILLLLAVLTPELRAQALVVTQEGTGVNDYFGASCASIGDVDNDGIRDYLIGAPGAPFLNPVMGTAQVYSGATNAVLFALQGIAVDDLFGSAVGDAGDVDDDGVPDFIVGATQNSLGSRSGYAQVFSGASGLQIHKVDGAPDDLLGSAAAGVGDLNADGFDDYAVGAPGATTTNSSSQTVQSGKVVMYSGKDKTVLATLKSEGDGDRFGQCVAAIADTNSDNVPDLLVGSPGSDDNGSASGRAWLISGATFSTLQTVDGDAANDAHGFAISSVGDLNNDGIPDFAVGSRFGNYLRIYSGVDGSTIRTHTGTGVNDGLGQSVTGPGDLDGDGVADVLVGAHHPPPFGVLIGAGYARGFSGATGSTLFTLAGAVAGDYYGSCVAGIGDVNKDGVPDFIVGADSAQNSSSVRSGIVEVYSGIGETFSGGAVTSISLAAGGTQTLSLDAGPGRAGKTYLVLGTVSGTSPGLPLGDLCVPITYDAYTEGLLRTLNQIPLLSAISSLDAAGQATAQFVIPAGFPAGLSGLTLHHAFILADPLQQIPEFTSNAVRVDLVN